MSKKRLFLRLLIDAAVIAAAIGIPVLCSDYGRAVVSGADAVSSATVVLDAPSGEFLVLLNRDRLEEDAFWEAFFSGEDAGFCFEDITCMIPRSDSAALEMAQSFQSRLSEHQMTVRQEDVTLLLSRADHGKFQVIVLSKELATQYHADTVYDAPAEIEGVRAGADNMEE